MMQRNSRTFWKWAAAALLLLVLVTYLFEENGLRPGRDAPKGYACAELAKDIGHFLTPASGFWESRVVVKDWNGFWSELISSQSPLYCYTLDVSGLEYELLNAGSLAGAGEEAGEAAPEEEKALPEGTGEAGGGSLAAESLCLEDRLLLPEDSGTQYRPEDFYISNMQFESIGMEGFSGAEGGAGADGGQEFVPCSVPRAVFDIKKLEDRQELLKSFYVVDGGTSAPEDLLDVHKLLDADMKINKNTDGPQILIYHTHSQEGFADSAAGDEDTSIVGMGELLAQILREQYGYQVLHHTGQYDTTRHDYAYSYALPEISQLLIDNPSIQVVIDLHRDEVPADTKLLVNCNGKPTAQFMFFNGLSYVNSSGAIDYLKNPNLAGNLAFSFQMQKAAQEYYPGITRKIYLKGYRYNMHLAEKYLLVELGAQTNTVEEARNACYPLADVLDKVVGGH